MHRFSRMIALGAGLTITAATLVVAPSVATAADPVISGSIEVVCDDFTPVLQYVITNGTNAAVEFRYSYTLDRNGSVSVGASSNILLNSGATSGNTAGVTLEAGDILSAELVAGDFTVIDHFSNFTVPACIPDGITATVDVVCGRPFPRLAFEFTNNSTIDWVEYTTTYTINGGSPETGGGGGAPGSGGGSSIGISPGDVVSASISVEGVLVQEITDVVAPNCLQVDTEASVELVCLDGNPQLVIDITNIFETKNHTVYDINHSMFDGSSVTMGATTADVDEENPFHLALPVPLGVEVSAKVFIDDTTFAEIVDVTADCSDEGSGGAIPEAGSDIAPLIWSGFGLLGLGVAISFVTRRRRFA